MSTKKLEWDDKYSVGVVEIDNQHKRMFAIINELLDAIEARSTEDHLGNIIENLIKYKMFHFSMEEKYFREFNYDGTEEHIARHKEFTDRLELIKNKYENYSIDFAFELVDFLEDWLINHLLVTDHKYIKCFHDHGLK